MDSKSSGLTNLPRLPIMSPPVILVLTSLTRIHCFISIQWEFAIWINEYYHIYSSHPNEYIDCRCIKWTLNLQLLHLHSTIKLFLQRFNQLNCLLLVVRESNQCQLSLLFLSCYKWVLRQWWDTTLYRDRISILGLCQSHINSFNFLWIERGL